MISNGPSTRPEFRPAAAIVPTNTGLVITAASPSTQRVLTQRLEKQPQVMADLLDQIAERRKQAPAGDGGVLDIGVGSFFAQLPRQGNVTSAKGAFPRMVCLIATGFATGGAVDRRELFSQDRVRKGVAGCLSALDAAGATSVMMPLLGAASAQTQSNDPVYEGQRLLKECRHLNAAAGIALGSVTLRPAAAAARDRHRPVEQGNQRDVPRQPPRAVRVPCLRRADQARCEQGHCRRAHHRDRRRRQLRRYFRPVRLAPVGEGSVSTPIDIPRAMSPAPVPHFEITFTACVNGTLTGCTRARSMMKSAPAAGVGTDGINTV